MAFTSIAPDALGIPLYRAIKRALLRAIEDGALVPTLFARDGLADGVGMLVEQAAEAFAWWRGVRPDTRAVIAELSPPLA